MDYTISNIQAILDCNESQASEIIQVTDTLNAAGIYISPLDLARAVSKLQDGDVIQPDMHLPSAWHLNE